MKMSFVNFSTYNTPMYDFMVNGLHLYSTFKDPMATKALYILPHIHPFTHSFTHPTSSPGAAGVRCLAHEHLDTWSGGTRD